MSYSPRCWFYSSSVGVVVRAAALGGRGGRSRGDMPDREVRGRWRPTRQRGWFYNLTTGSASAPLTSPAASPDWRDHVFSGIGHCGRVPFRLTCFLPRRLCSVKTVRSEVLNDKI